MMEWCNTFLYDVGAFSHPHESVEDIIKHHISKAIEIEGREDVKLVM